MPRLICRKLLVQVVRNALLFVRPSTGSSRAARMPMMAMTTSSSINVNATRSFNLVSAPFIIVTRGRVKRGGGRIGGFPIHPDVAHVAIHEADVVFCVFEQRPCVSGGQGPFRVMPRPGLEGRHLGNENGFFRMLYGTYATPRETRTVRAEPGRCAGIKPVTGIIVSGLVVQ